MKYLELSIEFNRNLQEELLADLTSAGFSSLVINDPEDLRDIEEHPEWYKYDYINEELEKNAGQLPVISLYFSDDEEGRKEAARAESVLIAFKEKCAIHELRRDTGRTPKSSDYINWVISKTGDDSEWLYKWQEHFKPTKVGNSFVVKPSWEEYEAGPGELVIEMDPGMAFGSGLHETTTLCIKALEKCRSLVNVLDVGTGTGILAIAASMLGAERCLGIDIDADAVRVAEENVKRNGLAGSIELREGDLMEGVDFDANIIVANLMADLVSRLAPAAAAQLKAGGIFISSGILDIKEDVVSDAVREAGFEILEVLHDGEWCAIVAEKEECATEAKGV